MADRRLEGLSRASAPTTDLEGPYCPACEVNILPGTCLDRRKAKELGDKWACVGSACPYFPKARDEMLVRAKPEALEAARKRKEVPRCQDCGKVVSGPGRKCHRHAHGKERPQENRLKTLLKRLSRDIALLAEEM